MDELVRQFLKPKRDPRAVITDDKAPYFGTPLDERSLIPGKNARIGKTRFNDWLARATTVNK